MVWGEQNNDNNNKNNKEKKTSWGQGEEIENFFKNNQNKFDNFFKKNNPFGQDNMNFSGNNNFIYGILFILFAIWLASGFYIIEEDEQAVVLRFGKFVRIANPGPNFHLPYPIESTLKHKVTVHQIEEFGYRSAQNDVYRSNRRADLRNIPEESLMLTGDENIVDINFMVKWKIDNIQDYVLNVSNPRETVKMAAESAVREIIGNTPFAEAQTLGRSKVEVSSMNLLQDILNLYKTGITIVSLQMLKVDPPQQVIDAFRDVQTARADKEREINEAYSYKNDLLPRTRGEATKIVQGAIAYKSEVTAKAQGESSRYKAVYDQYKNAKSTLKKRLYIETMESILGDMDKIIIDQNAKNLVPYLPLDKISKSKQD
ncbi:MAG: FtsH protease activity modulator HflK [Sphingobacteriia bacterium]|nr:FtsH protease activity modulator HflK [Sphingobacteriia bacterium]